MRLSIENLVLSRGERIIIDRLSFALRRGETLLVTGPNGSGKTTLLRALAGFIRPDRGAIRLEGGTPELSLAEQCHYIGHANGVAGSLTVRENLAFWTKYLGGADTRVAPALSALALADIADIPVRYLSAGQKRRAGLARLLVVNRPVWLLDEPTAALDADADKQLMGAVNEHVAGGGIAVVATHLSLPLAAATSLRLGTARPS